MRENLENSIQFGDYDYSATLLLEYIGPYLDFLALHKWIDFGILFSHSIELKTMQWTCK